MRHFSVALVHYPILDRAGNVITTAVTNIDVHDLARSSYCYGADALYIVHPIEAQRKLVQRIQEHWVSGTGARRIPDRVPPMSKVRVVESLEEAYGQASGQDGSVEVWSTSARSDGAGELIDYGVAAKRLCEDGPAVVLLFGTGWGLADEAMARANVRLPPIQSSRNADFNHLSVRAACAITLDRLVGVR